MAQKQIQLETHTAQVVDTDIGGDIPIKELRATVGGTTVSSRITFGGVYGPRPNLTLEQIQNDLDMARQKLAEEAAWRENLRTILAEVD